MDISQLTKLKAKLVTTTQFSDVFSFFMDHFGNDVEFLSLGDRTRHPLVETVIDQVAKQIFGREVSPLGLTLTRITEEQFLHGGFILDGHMASVFYFDDVHVGLMTVIMGSPINETRFARFTGQVLPEAEPSLN